MKPNHTKTSLLGRLPLPVVLTLPFTGIIVILVGLTGYLSFQNGQRAVNDVAMQLRQEISHRIDQHLTTYLAAPHLINQLNFDALQQGELNPQNLAQLERHFWQQIQRFETAGFIFYANEAGELVGTERLDDGRLQMMIVERSQPGDFQFYFATESGERGEYRFTVPNFDPRQRPWYLAAQTAGEATWGSIFNYVGNARLAISAVTPLFDGDGRLQGVIGTDLILTLINNYLHEVEVGKTGQTFIMERSGALVAHSLETLPYLVNEQGEAQRIQASESDHPLIGGAARFLREQFGNLDGIEATTQLDFMLDGRRQFVQVTPFQDEYGLDWLIVVVIPEADFMTQIQASNRQTAGLIGFALLVAISVGVLSARWVTQPISRLNESAQALAAGEWHRRVTVNRHDEVGQLAQSFNRMAAQLQESFETLEQRVVERTAALAQEQSALQAVNRQLERQGEIADSLRAVAVILNQNLDLADLLNQIMGYLKDLIEYSSAELFLREGDNLVIYQASRTAEPLIGLEIPLAQANFTTRAYHEQRLIIISDVLLAEEWQVWEGSPTIRSWMGAPLVVGAQPIGVVTVHSDQPGMFQAEGGSILEDFATLAAQAIRNARLFEQAQIALADAEAARQRADAANEAKSEFLSNMSHELRTPLNGILGYTQILQRDTDLSHTTRNGLNVIEQSGNHLLTLITDILDLSKIEARKMELYPAPLNLPNFIETIISTLIMRAEQKGLAFGYSMTNLPSGVLVDEKRLRQVLFNLIGNAIKFTEEGRVTLRVKGMSVGGRRQEGDGGSQGLEVRSQELGNDSESQTLTPNPKSLTPIRFEIEDTGVGMTAEELTRVFEAFEQVGDVGKRAEGTGLGMSISQQLVTLMGGALQVRSEVGVGSTFWFEIPLPVVEMPVTQIQPPSTQQIIGYEGPRRTVLIVDDILSNRQILRDILTPLGFEVIEAEDGQAGMEAARQHQPDLILTDLVMPRHSGLDLIRAVRADTTLAETPIVIISASSFDHHSPSIAYQQTNGFLSKPVNLDELLKLIGNCLYLTWRQRDLPAASHSLQDDLLAPPSDLLQSWLEMASMGDLIAIEVEAESLARQASQYVPFVTLLCQLTREMDMAGVAAFLQAHGTDLKPIQ